jgi:hypothetical protein
MKKAYLNYKKYGVEDGYNPFSDKTFELRYGNAANKLSATKTKTRYRYYLIKDSIKNKYPNIEIDDIAYDS